MRRTGWMLFALALALSAAPVMVHAKPASADTQTLMLPWLAGNIHNIYGVPGQPIGGYSYYEGDHIGPTYKYAIDWNLPAGTGVVAVRSGSAYTGFDSCGGYYVAVNHGSGLWSYYGHLDGATINNWVQTSDPNYPQHVSQGQQIARSDTSGSSGCIQGAHLHFHMLEYATGPLNGSAHFPEPMTGPNGTSYSGFGSYGYYRGTSPDYTSTFALPHTVHPTGSVAWWDTTVTPNVERVNAFYLGSDGYAYINYLDSGHWYWLAGSRPSPGVTLLGGIGVVDYWDTSAIPNVERVNAFYFGSDGNTHIYYLDASSGRYFWTAGKRPGPNVVAGAGTVQYWVGTTLAVNSFELASDGKSYIEYWDTGTHDWQFTGGLQPAGVSLLRGAGAQQWWDASQRVNAYLVGYDGSTYKEFWSGTAWTLASGSKPSGTTVGQMVGATTWWNGSTQTVFAFAIGNDGYAYRASYATPGDSGSWSAGSAPGASLVGGGGAVQWYDTAQQADAFFQGSDGKIYRLFFDASYSSWTWDAGTKPGGNYLAGGVGAVAYMYGGTQAVDEFLMGTDGAPYIEYLYGSWGLTQEGNLPGSPVLS